MTPPRSQRFSPKIFYSGTFIVLQFTCRFRIHSKVFFPQSVMSLFKHSFIFCSHTSNCFKGFVKNFLPLPHCICSFFKDSLTECISGSLFWSIDLCVYSPTNFFFFNQSRVDLQCFFNVCCTAN